MQALATFISWTFLGVIISTQERTFTSQMAWTFEFSPPGYARADTIGHAPPFARPAVRCALVQVLFIKRRSGTYSAPTNSPKMSSHAPLGPAHEAVYNSDRQFQISV
jgi:hypothetical protein